MPNKIHFGQEGQTLLIVVLVMVVSLTIGLSVVSKSITNVKTSTEEANSAQALAAAEAGIQKTIQINTSIGSPESFSNSANYKTNLISALTSELPLNGGNIIPQDEGIDLWLMPHNPDGSLNTTASRWSGDLTIYWGDTNVGCDEAALEIILVRGNPSDPSTINSRKYAVDPCDSRAGGNGFGKPDKVSPPYTLSGKSFNFKNVIGVSDGALARIVPIYKNANIAVSGANIPSQGSVIVSTGASSEVQRRLSVFKGFSFLPIEYFSYGILSPKSQ